MKACTHKLVIYEVKVLKYPTKKKKNTLNLIRQATASFIFIFMLFKPQNCSRIDVYAEMLTDDILGTNYIKDIIHIL